MSHIVNSLREVAEHFGRCARTGQRWAKAGMPWLSGGRYDLLQVEAWLKASRGRGASLRQLEADERINTLFDSAVVNLRRGLEQLCQAYVSARGKTRARLIDRAVRDILHGAHHQQSLLEGREGKEDVDQ